VRQHDAERPTEDLIRSGPQLGRRERLLAFNAAAVVSLLVHAGILLAVIDWFGRIDQGAIPVPSDAVSVELVATDTLDALKPERPSDPAPSPEATAPVAGSSTPSERSEKAEQLEKHEPVEKSAIVVPDADDAETRAANQGEPMDAPAAPAADTPSETVRELSKATIEGEDARSKRKDAKQIEKKTARPEGGITSKAKAGKGTGSGRISASTGAILTYAALVRAHVAGNRPSGSTPGDTSIVAFGLTTTGAIAYARIARSSGNTANDRIALAAVRGAAPFPPPPAGATPGQLQFTIPYYFQ
jgi:protein TonB